ncbi:MAG: metallophosphoesterase [Candidatus Pacearchaeota archaeon]|jgi:calcineurin-like phosphoesterase family protein
MSVFVTSDTHFNGTAYLTENYSNLQISGWQSSVTNNDIVIHCGDVHAGKFDNVKETIKSLPGYKILVKGNHDSAKNEKYLEVFDEVYNTTYTLDGIAYSHTPIDLKDYPNCEYNIFGHFHVYPIGKDISKIRRYKEYYNFDKHFPICIWDWNWTLPTLEEFKKRFINVK